MAFNAETVKGILEKENASVEDKVQLVISEHEAETRGLQKKNGDLIADEKKLKEQLKTAEEKTAEGAQRVVQLEEQLRKNDPDEARKMWESEHQKQLKAIEKEKADLSEERDRFKTSHYTRLRNDAINEGIKDLQFVDGLRDGFVARVLTMHSFEPKEDGDSVKFFNKDYKPIEDVMREFALSAEGKAYIKNASTGGGAGGSKMAPGTVKNPWAKDTLNLTEQARLIKENPQLAVSMKAQAGAV
jgi:hypothetical protein